MKEKRHFVGGNDFRNCYVKHVDKNVSFFPHFSARSIQHWDILLIGLRRFTFNVVPAVYRNLRVFVT